tara:strand:+ start:20913 stop:21569 length:657 start_codon:yes stop_codon:yes gene_type:complete
MRLKLVLVLVFAIAIGGVSYLTWENPDIVAYFSDPEVAKQLVADLGIFGPIAVIGFMTAAIIFSPIPSAPIAIVSGMVFGHIAGAIYVIVGAETGAVIAFMIARSLGRDLLAQWFGDKVDAGLMGSQNALMFAVFISRLIPFISFDLMSYAAGLSALKFWRFAIATFAGIIPASLFLTHFGGALANGSGQSAIFSSLALGAVTGIPLVYMAVRSKRKS